MFSKKPEFIDPEEVNARYYYDRKDREKRLEEKKKCCQKSHFLVFKSTKGRVFLVIFYLLLVGYIFQLSYRKKKLFSEKEMQLRNTNISISAYHRNDENKTFIQILLKNPGKKERKVFIKNLHLQLKDSGKKVLAETTLKNIQKKLAYKGIAIIRTEMESSKQPYMLFIKIESGKKGSDKKKFQKIIRE